MLAATRMREHPMMFQVELNQLEGAGSLRINGMEIHYFPVDHGPTPCFGIDVRDGGAHGVVYSCDTQPIQAVFDRVKKGDLLVHECNKIDCEISPGHTTWAQIKVAVKDIPARQTVLVHLPPMDDETEKEFTGDVRHEFGDKVVVGRDGLTITV
jgi:ribonuclease BN (tRNA processing enzyme)